VSSSQLLTTHSLQIERHRHYIDFITLTWTKQTYRGFVSPANPLIITWRVSLPSSDLSKICRTASSRRTGVVIADGFTSFSMRAYGTRTTRLVFSLTFKRPTLRANGLTRS
jgi:hypothetical protein